MKKQLLIGCGSNTKKRIPVNSSYDWTNLVTLDINPEHKPDIVWDLTKLPLPFADNEFSEIHAYEVLEHIGAQGDYKTFFAQFSELWRILEPNGALAGSSPMWNSVWAWGDPSHTRIIHRSSLTFLDQSEYIKQVGKTPMSDFRNIYKADFHSAWYSEEHEVFQFLLQAIKPSRYLPPEAR